MRASVIIRSKDEAPRLRLTLASLARQVEAPLEVVVVNDGSTDRTGEVLEAAAAELPLVRLDHRLPLGRSAASNAGAALANGDVLIFLDGDTLAHPELVARHLASHRSRPRLIGRGETWHLRCTRSLADPEAGTPRPGEEARISRLSPGELDAMRVTREQVSSRFETIEARAQPGIYPGAGPRRLYDLEMETLRERPDSRVLWAAAAGANQSVAREPFLAAGGFDARLTINEHRELALRLCSRGLVMGSVEGARSYHLTHRSGWRDPVGEPDWEDIFYAAHPLPEVALLSVFWGSLADRPPFPPEARIGSLAELETAAARCEGVLGVGEVRRAHLERAAAAARSAESRDVA